LYPIHPLAFGTIMLWQIVFNVIGHTGYKFHPRWLMDTWLGRVLNTPTNHAMHHEKMVGNYGLYFNVWDRLMGTNHERYEERFRAVTARDRPPQAHA
jgi:Delta7-sterol 5-desaturase